MDQHPRAGDFTALPMLAQLGAGARERLRASSFTRRYPRGQILRSQGDPADQLLILEAGRLKAGCTTARGREVVLGVHTALAAFDKAEVLTAGTHPATLTALTPVTVRFLPAARFVELVEREPSVRRRVLTTLAGTLDARTRHLVDIATLDVPSRLARWLLGHAALQPWQGRTVLTARLPASQSDLAAELGTTRVTVNRILRGFHAAGLVAIHADRILLLSPEGLTARGGSADHGPHGRA